MARYLVETTETYRVDEETEVNELVESAKEDTSFELTKYNCEYKEKKQKGEVIDHAYVVKLTKKYYANIWEV